MTALYLLFSLLSAAAFYLGTGHQRLWTRMLGHRARMRALGWLCAGLAIAMAVFALGVWAGAFCALTGWMFGAVLLPYFDAWLQSRKGASHVE
ncbi:hypothetical protein [Lysobacter sp. CA199]|uniref:hypothetical protein n=1 Tax=Lysobacter sp. CA199 TaxID=3455608 RepID=UPI003F8D367E